ncbi:unnamed protein product [Paramecium octaurelia]|uniref:Guanylate cyclase domain-containing protein n=1 Tax=Paramecium octaurelia TaxID=43137 RepID=A0A8S1U0K8_PAROT|nr:unnamed protein product [Paramecium octaurelia]
MNKKKMAYHKYIYKQSEQVTNRIIQIYSFYYFIKQFSLIGEYNNISLPLIILQWIGYALNNFIVNDVQERMISYQVLIFLAYHCWYFCDCRYVFIFKIFSYHRNDIYSIIFNNNYCIFGLKKFCSAFASLFLKPLSQFDDLQYQLLLLFGGVVCGLFQFEKYLFKLSQGITIIIYLFPKHILQKFHDDYNRTRCLSDKIENVTILFADIAGFTEYSSQVTPEEVLLMLKNLFVEFDRKCYELNVYKLYTIGDCYVAFGMIDYNERNPTEEAKNIVDLAYEIIRIIEIVRKQINLMGLI